MIIIFLISLLKNLKCQNLEDKVTNHEPIIDSLMACMHV